MEVRARDMRALISARLAFRREARAAEIGREDLGVGGSIGSVAGAVVEEVEGESSAEEGEVNEGRIGMMDIGNWKRMKSCCSRLGSPG